ncbi:TIGR03086 family metal-binding protein [Pseudonocardia lacus]|uniref:TIGR03086 family metal-binding protein n=1 Tax=Pseudonocardia lacus TaxID=2835865 RepID=UPI001BDC9AB9|nr:TIGR03086 family metal-binding protein [Pseudonocardia lacus]
MTTATTSVAALYERCSAGFAARVGEIAGRWSDRTPLPGWDVRDLVHHVVAEERWTPPLLAGATIAEVGSALDGDLLGAGTTAAEAAAAAALAAVTAQGALERIVHLSYGDAQAPEYVMQLAADHLVHTWDLARALGTDERLDPDAVDAVLAWFADAEPAYRAAGLIGPRAVPAADTPQHHLLARFGRTA